MPGFLTLQSRAIPPRWMSPSITKPSRTSPGSNVGFAMTHHLPMYSLCAKNSGSRAFLIASAAPSIS